MKYLPLLLLALPVWLFARFGTAPSPSDPAPAAAPTGRNETPETAPANAPVVLELFTSQGCSSCPPADDVLRELAGEKDVIALSYHVDYWNYLGWADPFSSPDYSARQRDYSQRLRARTYTPQLVINGRDELVGSRRAEVKAKVAAARRSAATAANQPTLSVSLREDRSVRLDYQLPGNAEALRVTALLVQNEAGSSVRRGENRGRELRHANVVRAMKTTPAANSGSLSLELPEGLDAMAAHVVLLVEDAASGAIAGAATASLSAR